MPFSVTTLSPLLPAPIIAVDWGSTHLRAKLLLPDGTVAANAASSEGIRHLGGRDCDGILATLCGAWKEAHPDAKVVMSGMIGSREGWCEAPYVFSPCGLADLAGGTIRVPSGTFGEVIIIPGVRRDDPETKTTDVMRGEETQAAGMFALLPDSGATLCLPGTHSKWIRCQDEKIESFRTWLTGEAYDRLTRDSLISGDGSPADPGSPAFSLGLEQAKGPGGLLHQLFLGRTGMLTGRFGPGEVRSFVSGLLIGHEIREASLFSAELPVWLIGDTPAAEATAAGLQYFGIAHDRFTGDAHLEGIMAITRLLD